jgi:hypothetical protein
MRLLAMIVTTLVGEEYLPELLAPTSPVHGGRPLTGDVD